MKPPPRTVTMHRNVAPTTTTPTRPAPCPPPSRVDPVPMDEDLIDLQSRRSSQSPAAPAAATPAAASRPPGCPKRDDGFVWARRRPQNKRRDGSTIHSRNRQRLDEGGGYIEDSDEIRYSYEDSSLPSEDGGVETVLDG